MKMRMIRKGQGKTLKRFDKRKFNWLPLLVAFLLLAAGCSSGKSEDKASRSEGMAAPAIGGQSSGAMADSFASTTAKSQTAAGAGGSDAKSGSAPSSVSQALSNQAAPTPTGSGLALANSAGAFDRKIMYKANVAMEVEHYGEAQSEIKNKALLAGGYIVQFAENRTAYELSGTLTVKIPSSGFTGFIADLEQMKPKSIQQNIQGQDVTEEFVDLTSRLKAKQVVEARLLDFLGKSTKTEELISFSNELGKVQEEIEKIKGRMTYLEQNVAFSTVEIRMYEKLAAASKAQEKPAGHFGDRIQDTAAKSASVMLSVLQGLLLFLAGAIPVLAVLALLGVPLLWLYRMRRQSAALQEERAYQIRQSNKAVLQHPEIGETSGGSGQDSHGKAASDETSSL